MWRGGKHFWGKLFGKWRGGKLSRFWANPKVAGGQTFGGKPWYFGDLARGKLFWHIRGKLCRGKPAFFGRGKPLGANIFARGKHFGANIFARANILDRGKHLGANIVISGANTVISEGQTFRGKHCRGKHSGQGQTLWFQGQTLWFQRGKHCDFSGANIAISVANIVILGANIAISGANIVILEGQTLRFPSLIGKFK